LVGCDACGLKLDIIYYYYCGVDGGHCSDILNGPYAYVPFTEIPLSALGLVAYSSVVGLAVFPLLDNNNGKDDHGKRVALEALTTAMGTFLLYLMTLLFGVMQTSCPYCVFSAACSILFTALAWSGGCGVPVASFLTTTVAAILLFVSAAFNNIAKVPVLSSTLLASTASLETTKIFSPPSVTTESSKEAMVLAKQLNGLHAKKYGAYWCSHCYEQKEVFGKEVFGQEASSMES
jgi:uncharacterized membrane protein